MEIAGPLEMGEPNPQKIYNQEVQLPPYIGGKYLNSVPIFK
jgi:hypothetical protein